MRPKLLPIFVVLVGLLSIIIFAVWFQLRPYFEEYKEDDANVLAFNKSVVEKCTDYKIVSLKELTPFKWDKVYIFKPYATRSQILETVGIDWPGVKDSVSDNMKQIVFTNNGKVICHVFDSISDYQILSDVTELDYKNDPRFVVIDPGYRYIAGDKSSGRMSVFLERYNDTLTSIPDAKPSKDLVGEWRSEIEIKDKTTITTKRITFVLTREGIIVGSAGYDTYKNPAKDITDMLEAGSQGIAGGKIGNEALCEIQDHNSKTIGSINIYYRNNECNGNVKIYSSKAFKVIEGKYTFKKTDWK